MIDVLIDDEALRIAIYCTADVTNRYEGVFSTADDMKRETRPKPKPDDAKMLLFVKQK